MRSTGYADEGTLDERAGEWLELVRSRVPPRPHLRLDPQRAALLVVDMLRYFADPAGRCYLPAAGAVTPRIAALVSAFRAAHRPVVFTRHGHTGEGDLGMLGRFFSDYIRRGEPESEIIDALAPLTGEPVVDKTTYDAFWGTPLAGILEAAGVEQLVIAGVLTHMCCETTARAAFCRGLEVFLPVDGTASSTEELHLGALLGLADAAVIAVRAKEVVALCGTRTSR